MESTNGLARGENVSKLNTHLRIVWFVYPLLGHPFLCFAIHNLSQPTVIIILYTTIPTIYIKYFESLYDSIFSCLSTIPIIVLSVIWFSLLNSKTYIHEKIS
jgi:hypothetical protein